MWCFPVKSCGPIAMTEINCKLLGPEVGHLRDRVFMVARLNGECVTARTYPKMVRIIPKIEGDLLTLSAPGMVDFMIEIGELYSSNNKMNVTIWGDDASCVDCGDEAAEWFSSYILGENVGFRFVFYPNNEPKPEIKDKKYLFEQTEQKDSGALHDESSFMLMNQGSFDDLNTKIKQQVTPLQFRPNFVVKGPAAWEEDKWKWVKIGDKATFRNVMPCIRCVFTNIDPAKGERNPEMEPLKTLKTFRAFKHIASGPWFGTHLAARSMGKVKLGDSVYVSE